MAEGTQIGAYQIERELGRGGFGIVYIGVDTRLGRRAAIKQLLPELTNNREIVERFFNEARAAANIDHPGIVDIYEVGWTAEGAAYFAMKLLEGDSLAKRLDGGPFPIPFAAAIARQVASALAAAHARGIVHRDLKPDNIILVPDEEVAIGVRATILDFGIAKLFGAQPLSMRTATGMMMGTPYYMSPEQCRGAGEVDHRTDVYALGCILFEMLAGRPPFVGTGAGEILGKHQFVETPALEPLRADVPPELAALVARMLAKEPEDRPQQMSEVAAALQPFTGPRSEGTVSGGTIAGSSAMPVPRSSSNTPTPVAPAITTLGASSAESLVQPPKRSRALLAVIAGVVVASAAVVVVVATRSSNKDAKTPPDAAVAMIALDAPNAIADAPVIEVDAAPVVVIDAPMVDAALVDAAVPVDAPPKPDRAAQIRAVVKLLTPVAADCTAYETKAKSAEQKYGKAIVDAARAQVKCTPAHPTCDGSDERAGDELFAAGSYSAALVKFEAELTCRPNVKRVIGRAFLAACKAKNLAKARALFRRLGPHQQQMVSVCLQNGIDPRDGGGAAPSGD